MSDPRLLPCSGRAVLRGWETLVPPGVAVVDGTARRIALPLVDLALTPRGARARQLLFGDRVMVIEERGDKAFVMADDGPYCGWIPRRALGPEAAITHRVRVPASWVLAEPRATARSRRRLPMGAHVAITGMHGEFAELAGGGYLFAAHLAPAGSPEPDPVAVAARFLEAPYLWGGDSIEGIDCSGLVHAALRACALPCPRDSDLQRNLGRELPADAPPARGDLLFWKGHVAMVETPATMLHATAHAMAVIREPLAPALARIETTAGPLLARRRISVRPGSS